MKTLMLTLIAGLLPLAAQTQPTTPPSPPACLSGPVTKGTLTVSCFVFDNTQSLVASDAQGVNLSYMLFVRAVSQDPAVVGVSISVGCTGLTQPSPQFTGQVSLSPTGLTPPVPMTYLFTNIAACSYPVTITSITVQELKPSSSQSY